ncbi:hypothetical protein E0485_20195 [Paenibacillus albiflavus]|uniref:Uncharacterized protein n=1 Tax=Paenibacillus albiflavus TaxID=2545760 RepID=A0A4V2WN78_9BACL|nr:hypothetical protein [Paenibacillus albiflavus]TCZ74302.1 hypothetical protein E0485_20195 [Paenibacillus albiflavus]
MAGANNNNGNGKNGKNNKKSKASSTTISPQSLAVIAALITKALTVDSVLIARDQHIEVLLVGSFKKGAPGAVNNDITVGELIELLQSAKGTNV